MMEHSPQQTFDLLVTSFPKSGEAHDYQWFCDNKPKHSRPLMCGTELVVVDLKQETTKHYVRSYGDLFRVDGVCVKPNESYIEYMAKEKLLIGSVTNIIDPLVDIISSYAMQVPVMKTLANNVVFDEANVCPFYLSLTLYALELCPKFYDWISLDMNFMFVQASIMKCLRDAPISIGSWVCAEAFFAPKDTFPKRVTRKLTPCIPLKAHNYRIKIM
jgi:hypothetical protein